MRRFIFVQLSVSILPPAGHIERIVLFYISQ